jgi:hypothetical protein
MPMHREKVSTPEGAFLPDGRNENDHVVVVYPYGQCPPEITVQTVSRDVQTVLADGVAVAVIACANGPELTPSDVMLVERHVVHS